MEMSSSSPTNSASSFSEDSLIPLGGKEQEEDFPPATTTEHLLWEKLNSNNGECLIHLGTPGKSTTFCFHSDD